MRKTKLWTAGSDCGRDAGTTFLLTEMDAFAAEWWANRLLIHAANAGTDLPDGLLDTGMAGVAAIEGIAAAIVTTMRNMRGLDPDKIRPLLDEMMACVKLAPQGTTPGGAPIPPRPLMTGPNCEIQEVATIYKLRWEVLKLHVDFLEAEKP